MCACTRTVTPSHADVTGFLLQEMEHYRAVDGDYKVDISGDMSCFKG